MDRSSRDSDQRSDQDKILLDPYGTMRGAAGGLEPRGRHGAWRQLRLGVEERGG